MPILSSIKRQFFAPLTAMHQVVTTLWKTPVKTRAVTIGLLTSLGAITALAIITFFKGRDRRKVVTTLNMHLKTIYKHQTNWEKVRKQCESAWITLKKLHRNQYESFLLQSNTNDQQQFLQQPVQQNLLEINSSASEQFLEQPPSPLAQLKTNIAQNIDDFIQQVTDLATQYQIQKRNLEQELASFKDNQKQLVSKLSSAVAKNKNPEGTWYKWEKNMHEAVRHIFDTHVDNQYCTMINNAKDKATNYLTRIEQSWNKSPWLQGVTKQANAAVATMKEQNDQHQTVTKMVDAINDMLDQVAMHADDDLTSYFKVTMTKNNANFSDKHPSRFVASIVVKRQPTPIFKADANSSLHKIEQLPKSTIDKLVQLRTKATTAASTLQGTYPENIEYEDHSYEADRASWMIQGKMKRVVFKWDKEIMIAQKQKYSLDYQMKPMALKNLLVV